jgi:hypothetical protein
MEQQIDATYLNPGSLTKAFAVGIAAVGVGAGALLAAWGFSFVWRPMPSSIDVHISNPELRVTQDAPFVIKQDAPTVVAQPIPSKINPATGRVEEDKASSLAIPRVDKNPPANHVITREVTVFSTVKHGPGAVVTGWKYPNGTASVPSTEYCYYTSVNADHSTKRIDLAYNRVQIAGTHVSLVPDIEDALKKCQWSHT